MTWEDVLIFLALAIFFGAGFYYLLVIIDAIKLWRLNKKYEPEKDPSRHDSKSGAGTGTGAISDRAFGSDKQASPLWGTRLPDLSEMAGDQRTFIGAEQTPKRKKRDFKRRF